MSSVLDILEPEVCGHGNRAGRMSDGQLWCPSCRVEEKAQADRLAAERARRERLARIPDVRARAANDFRHHTEDD